MVPEVSPRSTGLLPVHGRISCSACFDGQAIWGKSIASSDDGWTLENNPCAWGNANPRYLLLGFSKGGRQTANILSRAHDKIPYAGFRTRLTEGMRILGLLAPDDTIDIHIRVDEPDWAFGSLVRCGLAQHGKKSGTIIPSSTRAGDHATWIDRCAEVYLGRLPPRLETVVMLSNGDPYIESCFQRIKRLHPSTRRINAVAYGDGRVTWVHVVHLGGVGINHINDWLSNAANKAGEKRRLAVQALETARLQRLGAS